ncbi:hypothetical protein BFF78_08700 [Streptomyces fodineus]|uniref:Uncharacterized protein n=1 Tax=Streptomyces fodineus TaxID=1904616 RepID=A0A1D7Y6A0_9ACTN|nr:hypothetical protein BFF78_08700 [Streptomyces fodineus]
MLLALGTTMYGSDSAFSGLPSDWWKAVSSWYQGSRFSLQLVVRWPSQSTSMSAFQNTAPFLPHTGTVADVSSSVLYLPFDICEQDFTLASRSAALTEPSWAEAGAVRADAPADACAGSTPAASRAAPEAAARVRVRRRTVGALLLGKFPYEVPYTVDLSPCPRQDSGCEVPKSMRIAVICDPGQD